MRKLPKPTETFKAFIKRFSKEKDGFITIKKDLLDLGVNALENSVRHEIVNAFVHGAVSNLLREEVMNGRKPEEYYEKAFRKTRKSKSNG